ncbi:hypothetical protein CALVIDRAFT_426304 [Calocera viscosa TUFC12733]|uniref:Uncharacterized protein n=1 Tax=Calocera viscosa (strain TUFC12733) TaxID=1330018 RepID=A0A167PKC1_CALVF|nr:hypothetical protein CALVIDRAFT_426304 [Calocera viscosa TUFC12733]
MFSRTLRPAARGLPQVSPAVSRAVVQRRWASNEHDSHDSHDAPTDDSTVTEESFFTPAWRNTAILTVVGYAAYLYWPRTKEGETHWLTQAIANSNSNEEQFENLQRRMAWVQHQAANKREDDAAQRPPMHRFRYKHTFEQSCPNAIPVGTQADVSNVKIKTREDYFK